MVAVHWVLEKNPDCIEGMISRFIAGGRDIRQWLPSPAAACLTPRELAIWLVRHAWVYAAYAEGTFCGYIALTNIRERHRRKNGEFCTADDDPRGVRVEVKAAIHFGILPDAPKSAILTGWASWFVAVGFRFKALHAFIPPERNTALSRWLKVLGFKRVAKLKTGIVKWEAAQANRPRRHRRKRRRSLTTRKYGRPSTTSAAGLARARDVAAPSSYNRPPPRNKASKPSHCCKN